MWASFRWRDGAAAAQRVLGAAAPICGVGDTPICLGSVGNFHGLLCTLMHFCARIFGFRVKWNSERTKPIEQSQFGDFGFRGHRSEEHTSELQSLRHLVCRLLLEKKKKP